MRAKMTIFGLAAMLGMASSAYAHDQGNEDHCVLNEEGKLCIHTDGVGGCYTLQYDDDGKLTERVRGDECEISPNRLGIFSYHPNGRLRERKNSHFKDGRRIFFALARYDPDGRELYKVIYPNRPGVLYWFHRNEYDSTGHLQKMVAGGDRNGDGKIDSKTIFYYDGTGEMPYGNGREGEVLTEIVAQDNDFDGIVDNIIIWRTSEDVDGLGDEFWMSNDRSIGYDIRKLENYFDGIPDGKLTWGIDESGKIFFQSSRGKKIKK